MGNILGRHLRDVGVGKAEAVQLLKNVPKSLQGIAIAHVIEDTGGRESDADPIRTPEAADCLGDLKGEAGPVLD